MQSEESKGLSKLDIFGLVSGSIGLIADVISLSALFALTSASVQVPTFNWVSTLVLIVYTSVIVGFYSRRIIFYINRRDTTKEKFTKRDFDRIEHASIAITSLITGTLWLMFLWGVYQNVNKYLDQENSKKVQEITEKYEKMKPKATLEEKLQLEELKETEIKKQTQGQSEALVFGGLFALVISLGLIALLNLLPNVIYRGCDIKYQRW